MPKLATHGFSISFRKAAESELPQGLRPAGELICQWLAGEMEFTLMTSGSTGQPKPFTLTREGISHSAGLTKDAFRLKEGDWLLCALSLEHVAGFMMVMRAAALGCNLFVVPPSSNPLKEMPEDRIFDFASFVPLQMQTILEESPEKINGVKKILLGGGIVSASLEQRIGELDIPVYQGYGMTETYSHIALRKLNGPERAKYYKPLPGVSLALDERGCLCIESELTNGKMLITNDLVELESDGSFRWLGRFDNVINTGGVKVLAEALEKSIEKILLEAGAEVASFFVAGVPDERLGQKIILVIEGDPLPPDVEEKIKSTLPKHHAPKAIFYRAQFARTALGKLDKKRMLEELEG